MRSPRLFPFINFYGTLIEWLGTTRLTAELIGQRQLIERVALVLRAR
jgi:hypothetical protein